MQYLNILGILLILGSAYVLPRLLMEALEVAVARLVDRLFRSTKKKK